MKRGSSRLVIEILVPLLATFFAGYAQALPYVVHNGTTMTSITPLSANKAASDYYSYGHFRDAPYGSPAFGPESNTGFFWLYENPDSGDLSLSMIVNELDKGGYGRASFSVSGLPSDAFFEVKDDPADFRDSFEETVGEWSFRLTWNNYTDGFVIGLIGPWEQITMTITETMGIDSWYFLGGDTVNPYRVALNMEQALTITPIPEPSTVLLFGSVLLGLAGFRRRRTSRHRSTKS